MSDTNKKNKKLIISLSMVLLVIVFTASLAIYNANNIIQNIVISQLAKQGFSHATIEKIDLSSNRFAIYGLELSDNTRIGYLEINYEIIPSISNPIKLGNIVLDKIIHKESKSAEISSSPPLPMALHDLKLILSQNIPLNKVTIKTAKIVFPEGHATQLDNLRLRNTELLINNLEHSVNVKGNVSIDSIYGDSYASFTASANNAGHLNFNYEIEKGSINLPNLKGKRLSGWGELSYDNKDFYSQASINMGSASILGIPFRGVSFTYSDEKESSKSTLIGSGRSLGDIAQFSVAINISSEENNKVLVDGKIDISAKKLEELPKLVDEADIDLLIDDKLKTTSGSADIRMNFKGNKPYYELINISKGWEGFQGSFASSFSDLVIPPYINHTNLQLQSNFNPIDDGLEITAKNVNLSYDRAIDYNGSFNAKIKTKPTLKIDIAEIDGITKLTKHKITADIQKANISLDNNKKPFLNSKAKAVISHSNNFLVPMHSDISANYSKDGAINFKIKAQDKNNSATANIKGQLSTKSNNGLIKVSIPPITFSKLGLQPDALAPELKNTLKDTDGIASLEMNIKLPEQKTTGILVLKNLSTNYNDTIIENLNTAIDIEQISPLKINRQIISIQNLKLGIPFYNGFMNFSYDGSNKKPLNIHNAKWNIADGTISLNNLALNPKNPKAEFNLNISNLALQQLFKLAPLDGLEATGIINGKLPVELDGSVILIKDGSLATTTKGTIRYAPKDLPAFLQDSSNQNIVYLRKALNNFHYDDLSFTINGIAGDEQKITLRAEGKNPDFTEQRPIILNLNLEGALENILKQQTKAYTIPDEIQKLINKHEEKNEK